MQSGRHNLKKKKWLNGVAAFIVHAHVCVCVLVSVCVCALQIKITCTVGVISCRLFNFFERAFP